MKTKKEIKYLEERLPELQKIIETSSNQEEVSAAKEKKTMFLERYTQITNLVYRFK